ncbi:MAG: hypothetical protein NT027_06355 [Proteobacteria bacterium]|nr:hypothetical protein [Pseudomonadota bacterium]
MCSNQRFRYLIDEEYSKAALALGSLKNLDEVRYRRYLGRLNNAKFHFAPMSLVDINDSNHVRAIEAPCKLMQLAIHQWVPGNFTNEFLVNQELWNFMNRDHKAALLLHEIIYEDFFKELEERDSANAKRFVGLLVSGSLLNISAVEYNEMLRAMGLGKLRTDLLPMIAERRFSSRSTNSDSVLESMSLNIEDHSAENYHFITFAPQRFQLIEGQLPPGCRIDRILFHKQGSKGNFEWDLKCHSISRESMVRFLSKDIEIHLFTGIETLSLKIAR